MVGRELRYCLLDSPSKPDHEIKLTQRCNESVEVQWADQDEQGCAQETNGG